MQAALLLPSQRSAWGPLPTQAAANPKLVCGRPRAAGRALKPASSHDGARRLVAAGASAPAAPAGWALIALAIASSLQAFLRPELLTNCLVIAPLRACRAAAQEESMFALPDGMRQEVVKQAAQVRR